MNGPKRFVDKVFLQKSVRLLILILFFPSSDWSQVTSRHDDMKEAMEGTMEGLLSISIHRVRKIVQHAEPSIHTPFRISTHTLSKSNLAAFAVRISIR